MQENTPHKISPVLVLMIQAFFVFFSGIFFFLVLGLSTVLIDQVWNAGRVMPGVSMEGIDLSGMDLGQAQTTLAEQIDLGQDGVITLQYGETAWQVLPEQIGLQLDVHDSALTAFQFGRQGSLGSLVAYQILGRRAGHDLQPIATFNEQTAFGYLQQVAHEYDRPLQEAGLALNGTQVVATPGQAGLHLDITASLARITEHVRRSDFSTISLVVEQQQPEILDANPFAAQAQAILSKPFDLIVPEGQTDEGQSFPISVEAMVPMISFTRQQTDGGTVIMPTFNQELLLAFLSDLANRTGIYPQNPRFIFNDDTRQLDLMTSAVTGRQLNIDESLAAIQTAISEQKNSAILSFTNLVPEVSDEATAAEPGHH